jgi:ribonuclease Z
MIDIALAGTGGMMPLPERWLSVVAARSDGHGLLFDCGEGTQVALKKIGWGFRGIDAICISHLHADHVGGLAGLLLMCANSYRDQPMTIYGPPGLGAIVAGQRLIARYLPYQVIVHELWPGEEFTVGPLRGTCALADHGTPCLAYRLELPRRPRFLVERARELGIPKQLWRHLQGGESVLWDGRRIEAGEVRGSERPGLSLVYATDTRPAPAVRDLARGADLFICEATFGNDEDQPRAVETKHMTFAETAQLARDAGVRRLVLTHFSPALRDPEEHRPNAARIFPDVIVGHDGLRLTLAFEGGDSEG